jgi:O-antigen/teichoic acid export membrane protein
MRIFANAGLMLVCRVLADSLNVVLFVVISRKFGPEGIGAYSFGFAVAGFIWAATVLGIEDYGVREYQRATIAQRRDLLGNLLGLQFGVGCAAFVAMALFLWVSGSTGHLAGLAVALAVYQFCNALATTLFVPALAEQRVMRPSLAALATRGLAFGACSVLLIFADAPLAIAIVIFPIAGLFYLAAAAMSARQHVEAVRVNVAWSSMGTAIGAMWEFVTVETLGHVLARISIVALTLQLGELSSGVYATGLKLIEVACLPIWFLTLAAYPSLCRQFGGPSFERSSMQLVAISGAISVIVATAMYWIVPRLLVPILGPSYAGTEPVIALMGTLGLLFGIEIVLGRLLFAKHQQRVRAVAIASGGLVCLVANVWAIPRFGVAGAVYSTTASYLLVNLIYLFSLRRPTASEVFSRSAVSS